MAEVQGDKVLGQCGTVWDSVGQCGAVSHDLPHGVPELQNTIINGNWSI